MSEFKGEMNVPASPRDRVMGFLADFQLADASADIEVRVARMGDVPALRISIGKKHHALLASEARTVAKIMEDTMNKFAGEPETRELENIILGLRAGADASERS